MADGYLVRPVGADAHDAAVARDLEFLGLPPKPWVPERVGPGGAPLHDVVVVGAGIYGIAAAAALLLKGLHRVVMLDRAAPGLEGPWVTYARMQTLRSPKYLPGVALGIPSLTFRAWFEARFGQAAWLDLGKIPNAIWQDYLTWTRTVLHLPVRSDVEVLNIQPQADFVALTVSEAGCKRLVHARRVVLASGRAGLGHATPAFVDPALWPGHAAHTAEPIDFTALRGRRVAVVGAGPSAWDNAATALEHGAARVDMFVRRHALPQVNKGRGSATPGFFEGWGSLPADTRWSLMAYLHDVQSPPPHESVLRTLRHPGFHIHFGVKLRAARRDGDAVRLDLATGPPVLADFLILGTGFGIDLRRMPELAAVAGHIAVWADRYTPPAALAREELGLFPWLGPGFELQERDAGACPGLSRIHAFTHAAALSLGAIASDIPGVSTGAERLAHAISAAFFVEDAAPIRAALEAFDEPELATTPFFMPGALRTPAVPPAPT